MVTTTTDEPTTEPEITDEDREAATLADEARRAAREAEAENHAALERAVADLPAIPGRDEFLTLCQLARVYAASSIVPRALRDKPNDVLVVLMTGRDLGIPATAALRKVYVIDGQPSIAPQLKLSLVRKKRLGQVIPHPDNNTLSDRQGAIALGPGGQMVVDDKGEVVGWTEALGPPYWYTWDDAVTAGLVRGGCTPTNHTDDCLKNAADREKRQTNARGLANFCKDNWRKNPRRMLWARCSGFCADDYFAEATLGLYDPDELGMMLSDDGELLDANHVELPAGFGHANGNAAGASSGEGVELPPVDPDDAWEVQLRVLAMPEDAQAEFKKRWKDSKKVPGRLHHFPAEKLAFVRSLLSGVEQQWKAQDRYDPETGPAALMENVVAPTLLRLLPLPFAWTEPGPPTEPVSAASQVAPSGPETPAATDTAPDAPGAADGDEAPNGGDPAALPLDVPGAEGRDATDALLSIPDEVRTASDDDKAEWAVAYVKAMRVAEVDELLRRRYQRDTHGGPADRRTRLVFQLLEHELGIEGAEAAGDG